MKKSLHQTLVVYLYRIAFLLSMPCVTLATPIVSGDLNETCNFSAPKLPTNACIPQTITPVVSWERNDPNGLGAQWISYTNSGSGGVSPPNDFNRPIVSFFEIFLAQAGDMLALDVWADDTASVLLDGSLLFGANISQDNDCADGAIGCEPGENATLIASNLTASQHTLQFDVFQLGGDGFGVLWSGELSSAPAPTTLALMCIGLAGLGVAKWHQKRHRKRCSLK